MEAIFIVPSILFLVIVAPIWIGCHYRYKNRMVEGISEAEMSDMDDMLETIDSLTERIESLEGLLDEERPNWRKSTRRSQA